MTAIPDPNMGLFFGFDLGETPWNVEMDSNMQIIGGMAMLSVRSRLTTAPPGSPSNGDIYYIPLGASGVWAAHLQNIAIFSDLQFTLDAIGWLYVPVLNGWQFRVEDEIGEDGQMLSVFYDTADLTESVDLTLYPQKTESYTASGVIDFTNTITRSAVEIATTVDITNATREDNYQVGYAYYRTKQFDKAVMYLMRVATKKDGMSQTAYYHMADCYLKLEEKDYGYEHIKTENKSTEVYEDGPNKA